MVVVATAEKTVSSTWLEREENLARQLAIRLACRLEAASGKKETERMERLWLLASLLLSGIEKANSSRRKKRAPFL